MPTHVETLIVGGSAAGLAVARVLQERRLSAQVIDAEDATAIRWRTAYDRLHLHTPRSRSGLPYQPMPSSYPKYPTRQQVVDYIADYARALKTPPLWGRRASSVRAMDSGWRVETDHEPFHARNVVIATGYSRLPVIPTFPGIEAYGGEVLHTSLYKNGAPYAGKRVLVVGFGNSAAEIAMDLAEQGASPTLSVRGPVNVLPREVLGIPIVSFGLLQKLFSAPVADVVAAPVLRLILGDIEALGFTRLPYGPITEVAEHHRVPVLDIGALGYIRAGRTAVRPGIANFTANGVAFANGATETFDAVILGTGFRTGLEGLLANVPGVLDVDGVPLRSGAITAAPGLYFCGFTVATGGHLHQIGIESRRVGDLIAARAAEPA